MSPAQFELLQDKVSVWRRTAEWGPLDLRDYNTRAADALTAALVERAELVRALQLARWYVADHQEVQPNEDAAGHLALIDVALDRATK